MGGEDEEKRARVKAEILSSEKSYVSDIQTAIDVFKAPMLAAANDPATAVASREEISMLFSNLESIVFFNQQLLVSLEEEASQGNSTIGKIFIEMAPYLRMYCSYVNNHSRAVELHQELMNRGIKKDGVSKYQVFLQECCDRNPERTRNRQLSDLLIMPIQRVPRYRLLLEELLKRTAPGDEYRDLEMALAKIADAANLVNERLREFETRMMVLKVQDRLGNSVSLVQPHRMYVTEGVLQKMCRKGPRDYVFVLFSDMLLYGTGSNMSAPEHDAEQTISFKRQIDLSLASLARAGDTSFKITSPTKSFVVIASNSTTCDAWFNAIQTCVTSCTARAAMAASEHVNPASTVIVEDGHAPVWVPDKEAPFCQLPECGVKFTLLNRRHHCRMCGLVVCSDCSPHRWLLPNIDKHKPQRICHGCYLEIRQKFEEENFESAGSPDAPRPAPPPLPNVRGSVTPGSSSFFPSGSNILSRLLKGTSSSNLLTVSSSASTSTSSSSIPSDSSSKLSAAAKPTTSAIEQPGKKPVTSTTSTASTNTTVPTSTSSQRNTWTSTPSASNSSSSSATKRTDLKNVMNAADTSSEGLPHHWRALKDEKGRVYYWNVLTDVSQYEKPTGRVKAFAGGEAESSPVSSPIRASSASKPTLASKPAPTTKPLSPLNPTASKQTSPKNGTLSVASSLFGYRSTASEKDSSSSDPKSRVQTNQVPPSSPMLSPRAKEAPSNSSFKLSGSAAKETQASKVPTLAERLAALAEQGVFGDPQLARFPNRNSTRATKPSSGATTSPVIPPKDNRGSIQRQNNGVSTTSSFYQKSNGGHMSSPLSGTRPLSGQKSSGGQMQKPNGGQMPSPPTGTRSLGSTAEPFNIGKSALGPHVVPKTSANPRSSVSKIPAYTPPTMPPVNQSQGKPDTSRMTEVEFMRIMGMRRSEFDKLPAYRKVELKQAKGVA